MLAIAILSYATVLKKIFISSIFYGAFEALGSLDKVKQMPVHDRLAPILDLSPIGELLEWTAAVDKLVSSGDPTRVSELARAGVKPLLKRSKGADQAAEIIRKTANSLDAFCAVLFTCRGQKIADAAMRLKQCLIDVEKADILAPFTPLFSIIKDKIKTFQGDALHDGVQAVRWCITHGLIQQGFTILNEMMISWVLRKTLGDTQDPILRQLPAQAASILNKNLIYRSNEWKPPASNHIDHIKLLIKFFEKNRSVVYLLERIKQFRNDINHAGFKENPINEKNFSAELKELQEQAAAVIGIF